PEWIVSRSGETQLDKTAACTALGLQALRHAHADRRTRLAIVPRYGPFRRGRGFAGLLDTDAMSVLGDEGCGPGQAAVA
ncbi:hypothetical protein NS355_15795, partial [Sphingomonas yabuuchiae]